jgi:hypothetical protein
MKVQEKLYLNLQHLIEINKLEVKMNLRLHLFLSLEIVLHAIIKILDDYLF